MKIARIRILCDTTAAEKDIGIHYEKGDVVRAKIFDDGSAISDDDTDYETAWRSNDFEILSIFSEEKFPISRRRHQKFEIGDDARIIMTGVHSYISGIFYSIDSEDIIYIVNDRNYFGFELAKVIS